VGRSTRSARLSGLPLAVLEPLVRSGPGGRDLRSSQATQTPATCSPVLRTVTFTLKQHRLTHGPHMDYTTHQISKELAAEVDEYVEESIMFDTRAQFLRYAVRSALQKHAESGDD